MKTLLPNLTLFAFILLIGCTSTEKKVGNYSLERKYDNALKSLKNGSKSERHLTALKLALTSMVNQETAKKDSLQLNTTLPNQEAIYDINNYLIDKLHHATPFIGGLYTGKLDSLKIEEEELKTRLKAIFLEQGKINFDEAITESNKLKSQTAYLAFEKASKYGADTDSLQRMSLAHSIMVYNVKVTAPMDKRYQTLIDEQFRSLELINRKFKKIYYRSESKNIDCTINIVFDALQRLEDDQQSTKSFQRKIVTGTQTETSSDGTSREVKTYGNAQATVIKIEKIKQFQWNTKVYAESASNSCNITNKQFIESRKSSAIEINISGDERAAPEEYQRFSPQMQMTDTELVELLIEQIYLRIESEVL